MFKKQINFVTFEGIDGCGKTTQSKLLAEYFNKNHIKTVWTREPGGTNAGEKIRNILINNKLDNISELFLIMASRNEHIKNFIKPSIKDNYIVICDRYVDSSGAYQANDTLTIDKIYELHKEYLENLMPSITFYIDISYEIAHSRIIRRDDNDKYDYLGLEFFNRLRYNYEIIMQKFSERFIKINGDQTQEKIHEDIVNYISNSGAAKKN